MKYALQKINDPNCGDSGGMSYTFKYDFETNKYFDETHNARPEIGKYIRVGALFARTMSRQDWWQTNQIVEILEDKEKYVRFKTLSGSIYEWKCF